MTIERFPLGEWKVVGALCFSADQKFAFAIRMSTDPAYRSVYSIEERESISA
jgi:hypothetical protein